MASSPLPGIRNIGLLVLCTHALVVGVVTGVGAVLLRGLIALIHNVLFLGHFSFTYDANVPTPPSPWGPFIILVPVIGGAVVVYLVRRFAPEARGHGVPEVIDAIYYKEGRIRPVVVIIKSLASALSIGSGASVGREGPIIQIGSGIGSSLGQLFHLRRWETITLVAAGSGAGIAATFNTPLGAVMFAIELMLPELSARTLLPVVLATGTATYVGRFFFGIEPAFIVPMRGIPEAMFPSGLSFLPIYVFFGILCGVASAIFIRVLTAMEDGFDKMPGNAYTRNAIGMLSLGVLFYALLLTVGQYHVEGVGYATIQGILNGELNVAWLLALLFVAKLLATTVSLGSGASGGIFSPSLFLGATLGGCYGALAGDLWPNLSMSGVPFAIIGMAAVVGGATGAAMTAILMIFEMTRDYSVTVPAIISVASAIGIRRLLSRENIYTIKLFRRGHDIPKERHSHMFLIRHAKDVMCPVVGSVSMAEVCPHDGAPQPAASEPAKAYTLVMRGQRVCGVIPRYGDALPSDPAAVITDFTVVRSESFLQSAIQRMTRRNCAVALVLSDHKLPTPQNVVGVITRQEIAVAVMSDIGK
jgi:chloride channel protein, CIC family